MKNSTELQNLKNVLFNKGSNDEGVYMLCAVMELVGGYEQLMNLPLSSLKEIIKYLEFVNKQQEKIKMPRMRRR